jgi:hypothetical protein
MRRGIRRLSGLAIGILMAAATRSEAQVNVSISCSPGIPACMSLRLSIVDNTDVAIDQLFVTILSPGWQFISGPSSTVGTYSAQDSFGPFGGFTTLGGGGTAASIDFLGGNAFPITIFHGDVGTVDLQAAGTGNTNGLYYTVSGSIDGDGTFSLTVTPEPASVVLLATALVFVAALRQKRKKVGAA